MARKNQNDFGDFDFDAGLDFDFPADLGAAPKRKKSDKPIDQITEGIKDSFRSKFTDGYHIKSMARKALPDGFGRAWDTVDELKRESESLYDQAVKDLKPKLGRISASLDSLTPDSAGRFKRTTRKLREMFDSGVDNNYAGMEEDTESAAVERMLGELSSNEQFRQKEERTRQLIQNQVDARRFDSQQKIFARMSNDITATRNFLTTFNVSYQKKSLELQFRSYMAQAALLKNFNQSVKEEREFRSAMLLNTSMPDYAKTSNAQRWKQVAKDQTFGNINKSLFGSSRIAKAKERLSTKMREKMGDVGDIMEMIQDALADTVDARDSENDMSDLTGRKFSGWRMAGNFGGNILGDMLSDTISAQVKKLIEKNPALVKGSMQAGEFANNPASLFKKIKESARFKKMTANESAGAMLEDGINFMMELFAADRPSMTLKNSTIGGEGEDKAYTQVRANRSLTDVIPGYLARILREVTILRTGDAKAGLLRYDSKSGEFKTESQLARDLTAGLRKRASEARPSSTSYKDNVEDMAGKLLGDGELDKLSPKDAQELKLFLAKLSRSSDNFSMSSGDLKGTKEFKSLDKRSAASIGALLDSRLGGDSVESATRRFNLSSGLASTRSSIGSLHDDIATMIRDGNGDLLERSGVIRRKEDGDYEIDEKAYYGFYESIFGTSDVNVKKNIKPVKTDPLSSYRSVMKTKISDWEYKPGQGYGNGMTPGVHRGPMAQDVRTNFGEKEAPGGKKIDLVSLNGHTMAAVQQLGHMVEGLGAGEGAEHLRRIEENTRRISEQIQQLFESGGLGGGGAAGAVGVAQGFGFKGSAMAGHAGALFAGLLDGGASTAKSLGTNALKLGKAGMDAAASIWDASKGPLKSAGESAIALAVQGAIKATEIGTDLLYNRLPEAARIGKGFVRAGVDFIKNTLQRARDLYIPGIESPAIEGALLEAGFYMDQATGKVLRTIDDVMAATGDIVDRAGRVRLSVANKAQGVVDSAGKKVTTFARSALTMGVGLAVAGGQAAAKVAVRAFDNLKSLAPLGQKAMKGLQEKRDKVGEFLKSGVGFGGDERTVPVLIQIRDLLALDKSGPEVDAILGRPLTKAAAETTKDVLTQLRNLQAVQSPKEITDEVLKGGNPSAATPSRFASWMDKLRKFAHGDEFDVDSGEPSASENQSGNQFVGPLLPGGRVSQNRESIFGNMANMFGSGKKLAGAGMDALSKRIPTGMKQRGRGLFGRIAGSRLGQFAGESLSRVGSMATGAFGMLGGLMGDSEGGKKQFDSEVTDGVNMSADAGAEKATQTATANKGRLANLFSKVKEHVIHRAGGVAERSQADQDRQQERAQDIADKVKQSAQSAAEKAKRNAPDEDALNKIVGMAAKVMGGIADKVTQTVSDAGDLLSDAADIAGDGPGDGKRRRRGRGRLGKAGSKVAQKTWGAARGVFNATKSLGQGILNVGSKIPGAAKLGRAVALGTRAATVIGLATGGGSTVLGAAVSLIGTALSSPVVIGAAAIAGAAYGGYKLYKYVTRNSIDDYQRIRFIQYGLDGTDATSAYNSKLIALENYLLDGRVATSNGVPSINARACNPNDIRELFDISEEDQEQASKFNEWFSRRFQSVFLHHVAVLYRIDHKSSLNKLDSLADKDKLAYLSGARIDGIWSLGTSPFKGLDVLGGNSKLADDVIDAKIKTLGDKLQKDAKQQLKTERGPKGEDAANANTVIESAAGAYKPVNPNQGKPYPVHPSIPRTAQGYRDMRAPLNLNPSEDGQPPAGGTTLPAKAAAAVGSIPTAGGPIADGSGGMEYIKLGKDARLEGLHPGMMKMLLGMAQEYGQLTGKQILINEGFRTYERQAQLYAANPRKAAKPGGSIHEFGLALDINTVQVNELERLGLMRKYGFTRPIRGETWHIEPAGIQADIAAAKKDPSFVEKALQASLGRGGDGIGAKPSRALGGRDRAYAMAVFDKASDAAPVAVAANDDSAAPKSIQSYASPAGGASASGGGVGVGPAAAAAGAPQSGSSQGYASVGRGSGPGFSGNNTPANIPEGDKFAEQKKIIAKAASEAGADPNEMMLFAALESGFKSNAKNGNSSAGGTMQFINSTWNEQIGKHGAKYGLDPTASKNDPRASTLMAAEYLRSNEKRLKGVTSNVGITEKYMAHMLGAGGARSVLSANPNAFAASILPDQAGSNREFFFHANGRPRTVAELKGFYDERVRSKAKEYGIEYKGLGGTEAANTDFKASSAPNSLGATPATSPVAKSSLGSGTMAGIAVPGADVPFFSRPGGSAPKPIEYGSQVKTVAQAAPSVSKISAPRMGVPSALGSSPVDQVMKATSDLFTQLQTTTDKQITHLSSIDKNIGAMVPLLEKVVSNTEALNTLHEQFKQSSPGPATKPAPTASKKIAEASSFDNRRAAA